MNKKIESGRIKLSFLNTGLGNPRKITKEKKASLKKSLQELGDFGVIVIDEENNIISGNQRADILKQIDPEAEVDIKRLSGYTEEEKKIINLRANAHSGEFEKDLLKEWANDISRANYDLDLTGLADMIAQKEMITIPQIELDRENAIPEVKKSIVKEGQLWQLGRHYLLCGDATLDMNKKRLLKGIKADILFTDPPYGIDIVKQGKGIGAIGEKDKLGRHGKNIQPIIYDQIIGDKTTKAARKVFELYQETNTIIMWGGNYFTDFLPPSSCWVVWDKMNTGNFVDVELAWCNLKKSAKLYHYQWNGIIRQGSRKDELKGRVHPTQKPVGLFVNILNEFPGEVVLDPFGGSGSTLIACEKIGRKCFMMELSEAYCNTIIKRWEDYTGQKAGLLK